MIRKCLEQFARKHWWRCWVSGCSVCFTAEKELTEVSSVNRDIRSCIRKESVFK